MMTDDRLTPADTIGPDTNAKSAPATGASGISVGRIITWVLIVALAAVTGLEAAAKFSYDGTLEDLKTLNINATDTGVELSKIDGHISGWTKRQTTEDGQIVIRWVSLFKDYSIRLHPESGQPGRIGGLETAHAEAETIAPPSLPEGFVTPPLPPDPVAAPSAGGGGRGERPKPSPPAAKDLPAPGRPGKSASEKTPPGN